MMIVCPKCGCLYWEGEADPTCGGCGEPQPKHDGKHNFPTGTIERLEMLLRAYHYVLNNLAGLFWRDNRSLGVFHNAFRVMAAGLRFGAADRITVAFSDEVEAQRERIFGPMCPRCSRPFGGGISCQFDGCQAGRSEIKPKPKPEELWLILDKRQNVGNCLLFWGTDRGGYTTELNLAGRYTEAEAKQQEKDRPDIDQAVPLSIARRFMAVHVRADTGFRVALAAFKAKEQTPPYDPMQDLPNFSWWDVADGTTFTIFCMGEKRTIDVFQLRREDEDLSIEAVSGELWLIKNVKLTLPSAERIGRPPWNRPIAFEIRDPDSIELVEGAKP